MAEVTHAMISYGASTVYTKKGTNIENDLKKLDVSSVRATTAAADGIGYGICVTLNLEFEADDDENQEVAFQSVGMSFS